MNPHERPASDRPRDLGFTPQPMVRWLSPGELANASLRVVLSGVFGAYADKRELQGVWPARPHPDYRDRDEMWVDYVADVADGFDATMTVASVLAREEVTLASVDGRHEHPTQRGAALVMGGDQVYPTADYPTYRDRLIGPYRSALPGVTGDPVDLYAVPGNHDWYDGLTSFLRVFCQGQHIGGWRTRQDRSYFALQLPHGWWLLGIDLQFESYIDPAQLAWFRHTIGPEMSPGDSVVLCSATPSWIDANRGEVNAYENLDQFEREVLQPRGVELRLLLAGDKHHYARYAQVGGDRQCITAGGGGAYLAGTHHLPPRIAVPPKESMDLQGSPSQDYELATTYPSRSQSLLLRAGVLRLPFQNGSLWSVVGALYLIVGWSVLMGLRAPDERFATMLRGITWTELLSGLFLRPLGFLSAVALVAGMAAFSKSRDGRLRWLFGGGHAVAHLLLMLGSVFAVAQVLEDINDAWYVTAVTVVLFGMGGLAGTWLTAIYLLVADRFGHNTNELFAAQHIEGYNNFLRMHIDREGTLTLYPVRIQSVARWAFDPDGSPYDPWFVPSGSAPHAELIETPLRFERLRPP